jgi:choline dehydrogenase-like flavoprotein
MYHNSKAVVALGKERNDTVFEKTLGLNDFYFAGNGREWPLGKILNHVGMAQHHVLDKNFYMNMSIPIAGCAHQAGTCRFGDDPATSVLDVNCKAHELDNLYVVDTSFFPSIGAVNPALTAMANAIRVGEHLLSRMS